MCRLMCIAGIKKEHVEKVHNLTKIMAKEIVWQEPDGVGYAAITKDCQVYGEKWLEKDQAFIVHGNKVDPIVERIEKQFGVDAIEFDKPTPKSGGYQIFGNITKQNIENTVAIILHARKATQGSKSLENVHPFIQKCVLDGEPSMTALIHNGSIDNHEKLTKKSSTCDSEVILHEYLANQMYHNPWGIEELAKTLVGAYTVGVLGSQLDDSGKTWIPYLDIFKSNKDLVCGYVPEIETFVFTTNQHNLESAIKDAKMTVKNIFKVKDGFLHRLNAITGQAEIDAVRFTTSAKFMSDHNRQHENSNIHQISSRKEYSYDDMYPYGPHQSGYEDGVDTRGAQVHAVKKEFARQHPDLFTTPYLESKITDAEKEYFDLLAKDNKTDHAALKLVSVALGMV